MVASSNYRLGTIDVNVSNSHQRDSAPTLPLLLLIVPLLLGTPSTSYPDTIENSIEGGQFIAQESGDNGSNGDDCTFCTAGADPGEDGDDVSQADSVSANIEEKEDLVQTNYPGISLIANAGSGGDGGFSTGTGKSGGDGGDVAQQLKLDGDLAITNTETIQLTGGVSLWALGGDGGNGGAGGTGSAGDGGDGGTITAQQFLTESFDIDISSTQSGVAIYLYNLGGDGGDGNNSDFAGGGDGGDGGNGGAITIDLSNASIATESDSSHGIYALSEGGDGGDGGNGKVFGDGGDGGVGGSGGSITTIVDADITTMGEAAHGLSVQSIGAQGGEGGDGGIAFDTSGSGGDVGASNTLTVSTTGSIQTYGAGSNGIVAQNIAGYAGDAGNATGIVEFGADGGSGGNAGAVDITNDAQITTVSDEAIAIQAQSIGGGGGNGGISLGLFYSESGDGSNGGAGGDIDIVNTGSLETSGSDAQAILAQSIGGVGGNGEISISAAVALGGGGATASDGGDVSITNTGNITTGADTDDTSSDGSNPVCDDGCSQGIVGQSIGGGGGNAGATGGTIAVGGDSGGGGNGGNIALTNSGDITTSLDQSSGVSLESIGGGGGSALTTDGTISVGGSGGDGGDGGKIAILDFGGTIFTQGAESTAVMLQSIGGGGGNGSAATSGGVAFSMAVGGTGGGGGDGGNIEFRTNTTNPDTVLETSGDSAEGLFAQSVGGGGGNGGSAIALTAGVAISVSLGMSGDGGDGGDGGLIAIDTDASLVTEGDQATGLHAQSVGGGGGSSGNTLTGSVSNGLDLDISLGGSAGDGGHGGDIDVSYNGPLASLGDQSPGVVAVSQGGGGGNAGYSIAGSTMAVDSVDIAVGGSGGGGGDGGDVSIELGDEAQIATGFLSSGTTSASDAVFAQSLGGGGGNAGLTTSASVISSTSVDVSVGGNGGGAGDGGKVTVDSSAISISTSGDSSVGIFAQSVGGSGGNSDTTISSEVMGSADISLSVGGDGGGSGDAAKVVVTSAGPISTEGDSSQGIFAQSIANSGGNAGLVLSGNLVDAGDLSFSVEGSGGSGGQAGAVSVINSGTVSTLGDNSTALSAQSTGGGGGSSTGSVSTSGLSVGDLSVAIGGAGGDGGTAGDVDIDNADVLSTLGDLSHGIAAQSIGGGGGSGGYAANASVTVGEYSGSANFTIGGDGGSGGEGGQVTIENQGPVSTQGSISYGVMAQSLGGSGGSGGAAYTGVLTLSTEGSADVAFTVGGDAGGGSQGGSVTLDNDSNVTTTGLNSVGLFAQSVGGSGGVGGNAYSAIADVTVGSKSINNSITVGGNGGEGSVGGDTDITTHESTVISTSETGATGVFSQSIGGSGGNAGSSASILLSLSATQNDTTSVSFNVSVGGTGGSGADAGSSTVDSASQIVTTGDVASAIIAQSVGGGGGNGGAASAYSIVTINDLEAKIEPEQLAIGLTVSIGAGGGSAGDGSLVAVTTQTDSDIQTSGLTSYGIFGQSVGGGGGTGGDGSIGFSEFTSSDTDSDDLGATISTYISGGFEVVEVVDDADELSNFLSTISYTMGGSGGASGDGDDVNITQAGSIVTMGDSATAVFAQSVGGGGGSAGDGMGKLITTATVGGTGSGGGDGGNITIDHGASAMIITSGVGAMGIFAQSVGGGGGTAGDVERAFVDETFNLNIGVSPGAIQLAAGEGGDGGNISIVTEGSITTSGDYAHGIWAQSVGGGGGASGESDGVGDYFSLAGSGFDEGDSGDIDVVVGGDLSVSGESTVGVFIQSASGVESGDAGDVSLTISADVLASGAGSRAVLAQSEGNYALESLTSSTLLGSTSGNINIVVNEGATVSTTGDAFETIALLNGLNNSILNYGVIEAADMDAYAVYTLGGTVSIANYGTFSGSVFVDASSALSDFTFTNYENGILASGSEFNLAADTGFFDSLLSGDTWTPQGTGLLVNNGIWSPAGVGVVGTTLVTADEVLQSTSGIYTPDLIMTGTPEADYLILDVNAATFAGTLSPNVINVSGTNFALSGSVDLIEADTGTLNISNLAVEDRVTVVYDLESTSNSDGSEIVSLAYKVEFGGTDSLEDLDKDALTDTADFIEDYLEAAASDDSADVSNYDDILTAVLNVGSIEDLEALYDSFSNDETSAVISASTYLSTWFSNALSSCPATGQGNPINFRRQGECSWFRITLASTEQDEHRGRSAYEEDHYGVSSGVQWQAGDDFYAGVGFTYDELHQDGNSFDGDGYSIKLGGVLKKEFGIATASVTAHVGYYDHEIDRYLMNLGAGSVAVGKPTGTSLAAEARLWWTFSGDRRYVEPFVGLHLNNIWQDSYTETGSTEFNLEVDKLDHFTSMLRVGAEFGTQIGTNKGSELFVRAGINTVLAGDEIPINSRFVSAGPTGPQLELESEVDRYVGELSIGANLVLSERITVSLNTDYKKSSHTETIGGAAKFRYSF